MAKLIVHNPPTVKLKASGYTGTPTGDIELTENNRTYNVSPFATATTAIPEEEKTVNPSTAEQVVVADEGLLKKVTVNPTPLEEKTVTPTTEQQTIVPQSPAIGFSQFTVNPVTPSIDPDIQPENIKQGVDILGVQGALKPPVLIEKTITENGTYTAEDDNADGYRGVTVAVPRKITKLVDGTITEYVDNEVTAIAPYAFYGRTALTTCIAPNARTIGDRAFQNTSALETVDFSSVETIGSNAFYGSNLTGDIIRFPNCQTIEFYAFRYMVYNDRNPRRGFFPKLLNIPNGSSFSAGTAWVTISCLVFKQKVILGTYDAELFLIRNNANYPISKFYVPQRYFDWYTTATNWAAGYAAYPNSIRTIEDNVDYLVSLGFSREELLREDEVPT